MKSPHNYTVRKECPLSKRTISLILADIRDLYPEADAVYVVGTYARVDETPSKDKGHDIDILIHFPGAVNRTTIERRDDSKIWRKWSGIKKAREKRMVDFLMMFGDKEPEYGQHIYRRDQNLKTPKVLIWRK